MIRTIAAGTRELLKDPARGDGMKRIPHNFAVFSLGRSAYDVQGRYVNTSTREMWVIIDTMENQPTSINSLNKLRKIDYAFMIFKSCLM